MNRAEPYPVTQTPTAPAVGSQPSTADRIETVIALGLQAAVILGFLVLPFLPTAENQFLPVNSVLSLPSRMTAYLSGWAYIGSGVLVLALTRGRTSGRAFGIFSAASGFAIAASGFMMGGGWFFIIWGMAVAVAFGALVHLALVYPRDVTTDSRMAIRWLVYLPGLLVVALSAFNIFGSAGDGSRRVLIGAYTFYGAAMISFSLLWMGVLVTRSASPYEREQASIWLLALCGAIILPFGIALLELWFPNIHLDALLGYLPLGIFPLVIAYSILRFEKLGGPYLLSRVVGYATLTVLILLSYALLVAGASILFSGLTPWSASVLVGVLALVLAFGLQPVKDILQSFVDEVFFRSQHLSNQRLQRFSQDLTRALDLPAIIELTRRYILSDLTPETLHVFIRDPLSDIFEAAPGQDGQVTTEVRFPASSVIAHQLAQHKRPMILGSQETLPTPIQSERARLALVGALLYIPLLGQQQLVGWLALGPRKSGERYSTIDVRYLNAIGNQSALAIERAQVIANLQRQVRETDVLARVAQGINITVRFDDILELIYAQTNHIIPCKDFQITLKDERDPEKLYHAFFVAEDERLDTMENIPLPKGKGLAAEVIREGTAIRSDDYERECRAKGVLPDRQGIEAWMGISLNAGVEVIGAICIGSREPGSVYTQRQSELLQAIADQAAGAIIKARLLEESERHARQLATINEIGRSLTSTLDISPLLTQILDSATEILNCEAGTLFSVEEESGEMVFEMTVGPVAEDLLGKRLPAGTGIVGKAVENREPIIANNVKETSFWFDQSDLETGFETRDLLVVPMIFKDRVTGVIEVINKKDGSPFTREDLELLVTFTSQAAIATENARLYTQTDEALTARLEEMSVLQRVDRELNTSLDLERTMRISLDWAMRQSQAEAGMIGHLDEGEGGEYILTVIASRGYTQLPNSKEDSGGYSGSENRPRLALPEHISAAIRHGQAMQFDAADGIEDETGGKPGLLEGGRSALIVPIRRQGATIALILLESPRWSAFSEEGLVFLSRLSDHAAIAVTNARLYADLQAANIAKSEYVSLVSHELKTPMTSIRGYTDLLSQGVVGEINDAQANFLSTIRTNVGRMATLVSDLADVSRIEADRLRLEFSAVDIGQVIDEVSHSQKALIDEKNQKLQVELPADVPAVWGDQNRLVQILTNLVSNANKYTPREGSIEISAEVSPNTWDPQGAPQVVHVRVKDNGYGISEEDRKKIFQKFFRSDAQNIRDAPGTGLGLNITRHLVEMQGGKIWFESELASGSVFQFTVPVAATG